MKIDSQYMAPPITQHGYNLFDYQIMVKTNSELLPMQMLDLPSYDFLLEETSSTIMISVSYPFIIKAKCSFF